MLKKILAYITASTGSSSASKTEETVANQNQALSELSYMFFQNELDPTYGIDVIDVSNLDFSTDSLKHINQYLEAIRNDETLKDSWNIVVLRTGAYVGEVIKQNDKNTSWLWLGYEDAKKISPDLENYGMSIGTAAVLFDGEKGFIFPLAKVEKYLENGKEDDLYFFAEAVLATNLTPHSSGTPNGAP